MTKIKQVRECRICEAIFSGKGWMCKPCNKREDRNKVLDEVLKWAINESSMLVKDYQELKQFIQRLKNND